MISTLAIAATMTLPSVMGHGYIFEGSACAYTGPGKCNGGVTENAQGAGAQCGKGFTEGTTDDTFKQAVSELPDYMGKKDPMLGGTCKAWGAPVTLRFPKSNSVCGENGVVDPKLTKDQLKQKMGYGITVQNGQATMKAHMTVPHGGIHAFYICNDNDASDCLQESKRLPITSIDGTNIKKDSSGYFLLDNHATDWSVTLKMDKGCDSDDCLIVWDWVAAGDGAELKWLNCMTTKTGGNSNSTNLRH